MRSFLATAMSLLGLGLALVFLFACSISGATAAAPRYRASVALSMVSNIETGLPFTQSFPRLGMWWPSTWQQPITDIARYDWVIYGDYDRANLPAIKALNPAQKMLNSTNACELSYDPAPDADPDENAAVRAIPPQWFLTQVGTTLAAAVNATQTVLAVNAVTVTDGSQVFDLFVAGDTALIDGESVYVNSVNKAARTLTVKRGYVRPAGSHPVGTRIAAHVTFWPGSWVLNLSTLCPTATVSATLGPENWAMYNARIATQLLADPVWDGLLIDRSDPNESWLIGNSTARTIDPDQSNHLLTDYSAFDASWNAGLRQYESRVRTGVGNNKIIFVNWGMPNYDLLNGNNFEGFPGDHGDAYGTPWNQAMFGPWPEKGSYFEWMAQALQPNLTMIETYEDDSGPDPTSDGNYDNPCPKPGFTPNYRKMRFGLATALLDNGFFSYEINTNGHGSLCLLWYDEYDNAGKGRGYLGQPLGPARRVIDTLSTPNLVGGGSFETQADLQLWDLWADEENHYSATLSLDHSTAEAGSSSAKVHVSQTAGTDWQISLSPADAINVVSGTEYTLSFWAKADRQRQVNAWIQKTSPDWDSWADFGQFTLTTTWQLYHASATATDNDAHAGLEIGLGQSLGDVWLDEVKLQVGSLDVWQRDFDQGLVLVNASNTPQTIPLDGIYAHIDGKQAPAINNGRLVTQASLPARDGLILLRIDPHYIFIPWMRR